MVKKVRVIIYGLGGIGIGAARILLSRENTEIVGAIDVAKNLVGRDVGEVIGVGRRLGVTVRNDAEEVLSTTKADVMILGTRSYIREVYAPISLGIKYGINVVTTAEDLANAWANIPEYARKIDVAAKEAGVTVMGTGVGNYFSCALVLALIGDSAEVDEIKANIIFGMAGLPLATAKAFGFGLTVEEFDNGIIEWIAAGGHEPVGRRGAALAPLQLTPLIADTLGWKLDAVKFTPFPVTSKNRKKCGELVIEPGKVCGFGSRTIGIMKGKEVITHTWRLQLDPEEDGYEQGFTAEVKGVPNIKASYSWDIDQMTAVGRMGTVGAYRAVANTVPYVINAPPGLMTFDKLPTITSLTRDLAIFGSRLNEGISVIYVPPADRPSEL